MPDPRLQGYIDGSRSDRLAIAAKHRYYLLGMYGDCAVTVL